MSIEDFEKAKFLNISIQSANNEICVKKLCNNSR